ncbi:MAG TPA: PDDEXK nuclease domain-containing protein [Candidatus Wallbacteria bacterium]|nr:PDDEXK nuclease domain-containing protein [Candidatus Wallbacteria bacterium]
MALKHKADGIILYSSLLSDIKKRIRQAQVRATFAANSEMIAMYWDIGRMIHFRQLEEGWSASVIPHLSRDLNNDLTEIKGFSERNLGRMLAFYRAYEDLDIILPQPVAKMRKGSKVPQPVAKIRDLLLNVQWGHHALLLEKVKDVNLRYWYMEQCIRNGWNRDDLGLMIKSAAHERQGKAATNFNLTLPAAESEMARQSLKDPYIFDFLTLREPFDEREFETGLVTHLEKFLLELGSGFAFVGRQYHLEVSEKDYYLDLLFYHLKLRCFIVIELKKGEFKLEYAGKMNFYCSAVDDLLKHKTDKPTIGLILCQSRDKILAEYALRDINKPIGVSEFELTRALPKNLKSSLPSIEDIEAELGSAKEAGEVDE